MCVNVITWSFLSMLLLRVANQGLHYYRRGLTMGCEQHDFTKKYTMSIRPVDGVCGLAGILLILSPLFNAYIAVGLGTALLLWAGFCHSKAKR